MPTVMTHDMSRFLPKETEPDIAHFGVFRRKSPSNYPNEISDSRPNAF